MRRIFALLSAAALLAVLVAAASPAPVTAASGIVFDGSPGTNPPPATLGGHPMTPFDHDDRFDTTTTVPAPGAGSVGFSEYMGIDDVLPWQPWPVGYTGRIYATFSNSLVLTLPAATRAFYFDARSYDCYAPSDAYGSQLTVTATAQDGTTSGPTVMGTLDQCAPHYFGFYATGSNSVSTITIVTNTWRVWMRGLAIGEFGIYRAAGPSPFTPSITSFSPAAGRVGTIVTITGFNLDRNPKSVTFNNVPAAFKVTGPTTIVARVPSGRRPGGSACGRSSASPRPGPPSPSFGADGREVDRAVDRAVRRPGVSRIAGGDVVDTSWTPLCRPALVRPVSPGRPWVCSGRLGYGPATWPPGPRQASDGRRAARSREI